MSMSAKSKTSYDITIIGGGMVGLSLALLLAQQKRWRIALIDSQPLQGNQESPDYSPSFDNRSTALSWSSRNIFQKLALWEQLQDYATAISQIHVSDKGHIGLARIQAQEAGVEALGYVLENSWLGSVLLNAATASDIALYGASKVKTVQPLANSIEIVIDDQTRDQTEGQTKDKASYLDSKLLVIADGADSTTAKQLGIQSQSKPYGHSAIIANIRLENPHQGIAYERFTDQGPMAMLPLTNYSGGSRASLVWTQPTEMAERLMNADDDSFLSELQERFGFRMGLFKGVGNRSCYPLALTTAEEQVRRRLVVIGNAAHSLHPVAGQGFNLSLRDVAALANNLANCPQNADIGELDSLLAYQKQQAKDQRNTILFSDNLPKLFGGSSSAVALGRNSGLMLMDLLPPFRKQFARFGMGLGNPQVDYG